MSSPHRPAFVKQGDGSRFQWLNCNCASAAMAIDRATLGQKRTTGAKVRSLTGDTSGGTNLLQVAAVARRDFGVTLTVVQGGTVAEFEQRIHDGQGAILQGHTSAWIGTKYIGTPGSSINHSVFVNEGRGWRLINGLWQATEYLGYNPDADARRAGIPNSPMWIPRSALFAFAARLIIYPSTGGRLGSGRVYAAYTRDTEPHYHKRHGGVATKPFPDRTRAGVPGKRVNVRSGPSTAYGVVTTLPYGQLFIAYQKTSTGQRLAGSAVWYGNHDGSQWIHESGLRYKGGST